MTWEKSCGWELLTNLFVFWFQSFFVTDIMQDHYLESNLVISINTLRPEYDAQYFMDAIFEINCEVSLLGSKRQ